MKSVRSVAAAVSLIVAGSIATVGFAGVARAYPSQCFDERLCGDLGDVHYCPDTGGMVSALEPCESLVTGPYAPGGLRPNGGLSD